MKQSLTKDMAAKLKYEILSEKYPIGSRLPSLRELAVMYGVSRSVVNAVIVELESEGYIRTVPTKWIEIADWKREGTLAVLGGLVECNLLNGNVLLSLLSSRRLIECECVKLACENSTPDDIAALRKIAKEEEGETCIERRIELDRAFHHTIGLLSGNFIYPLVLKAFEMYTESLIYAFFEDKTVVDFVLKQRHAIIDAIERRDPESAEREMLSLLEHGENIVLKKYNV